MTTHAPRRLSWILLVLGFFLTWPSGLSGHDTVEADRVLMHNGEWLPRFAHILPNSLIVPDDQTVTLSSGVYDAIEVAGTLRCDRSGSTQVAFIHFLILPGGHFDCGTAADPVTGLVDLIIRDVPLDLVRDPFQWGNGIVNFGTQTRVGRIVQPFAELAEDAPAGATTLTLTKAPAGWQVGDALILPDTAQRSSFRADASPVILAISGVTVSLSRPIDFAREAIRNPDGDVLQRPVVGNVTRNIVIRSENPAGTRGHTADIGPLMSYDIRGNQFVGVGRTTMDALDNTTAGGATIGTNQIGKYASHAHHGGASSAVRQLIGNSFIGTYGSKWAHAVHVTHHTTVQDNICVEFQGGCFVTEDGPEQSNVFQGNLAARVIGNGRNADTSMQINSPGGEGSAFWWRGLRNRFEDNHAWNAVTGFTIFNQDLVGLTIPAAENIPTSFARNVAGANARRGFEYWGGPDVWGESLVSVHNGDINFWGAVGNVYLKLRNALSHGAQIGVSSSEAYTAFLDIEGGAFTGANVALEAGLAGSTAIVRHATIQSEVGVNLFGEGEYLFEGVTFRPWGSRPLRAYESRQNLDDPASFSHLWRKQRGARITVRHHNGTGQDFQLFFPAQQRGASLPGATVKQYYYPPAAMTVGEAWDRFGMAPRGAAVDPMETITVPGVTGLLVRPGVLAPQIPRVVLTAAGPDRGGIDLLFMRTGDPSAPSMASIDGGSPITITIPYSASIKDSGRIRRAPTGTHTVRTWRQDVVGSEMTFSYTCVEGVPCAVSLDGSAPPPPPPDPDPDPTPDPPPPSTACEEVLSLTDRVGQLWSIHLGRVYRDGVRMTRSGYTYYTLALDAEGVVWTHFNGSYPGTHWRKFLADDTLVSMGETGPVCE